MNSYIYVAASEAAQPSSQDSGLFSALGIDVTLLLLQAAAFLLLVFLLGKFVYPHLLKAIDNRRATIEEGMLNAQKAQEELKQVEQKVADIIRTARSEAGDIVAHAQKEASVVVEAAEDKALKRAEHIINEAQAQMSNELTAARETLKKDTARLVALATEQIIKEKLDAKKDAELIEAAIKGAK
jgi:F-type H+-transporting ATPase subunit b